LFAPLPPEEAAGRVPLTEIEGLKPEITAILASGGFNDLNDVLDVDREAIMKIPGMTDAYAEELLTFLTSITETDEGGEDGR
jgi:N utilization substance protein A